MSGKLQRRITLLVVLLLLIAGIAHAAANNASPFLWKTNIVGMSEYPLSRIDKIAFAKDGGFFLAGHVSQSYLQGGSDYMPSLVKTDSAGNVLWTRVYDVEHMCSPSGPDFPSDSSCPQGINPYSLIGVHILEKADGGAILVTTNFLGLGAKAYTLVLIHVDAEGNEIGRNEIKAAPSYTGLGTASISDVLFTPEGDLVMVGSIRDNINAYTLNNQKIYAAKVDLSGNPIWFNNPEGATRSLEPQAVLLEDGGIAVWNRLSSITGTPGWNYESLTIDNAGTLTAAALFKAPNTYIVPTADGGLDYRSLVTWQDDATLFSPRRTLATVGHLSAGGEIDWSHSFAVDGHIDYYAPIGIPDGSAIFSGKGTCWQDFGSEISAIRVDARGSAAWAGGFVDCDKNYRMNDFKWAPGGGVLMTAVDPATNEIFLGLLPAAPRSGVVAVSIDVKPSEVANTVNLKKDRVLSVAVFSAPDFDATEIDAATITLAGAPVLPKKSGYSVATRDINRDGLTDLVLEIPVNRLSVSPGVNTVTLKGVLKNGVEIHAEDTLLVQ